MSATHGASRTVMSLASLWLALASCVAGTTPTSRSTGAPVNVASVWAADFAGSGRPSAAEAVARARAFGVIGAHPWTYRRDVPKMRQARPDLVLLAYMNGTFAQKGQVDAYPSSWYLRDENGDKVRSRGFGNYLMDPTNRGWIADRVAACTRFLQISGYDGCLVDMLGTAPIHGWYVTAPPIDRGTGRPWTASSWLAATSVLASTIRRDNPGATVMANGLGDGVRFFDTDAPSEQILSGIDGGIAEGWLRAATAPVDALPSVRAWRRDVDMLGATDKTILAETKVWTAATPPQIDAWHVFAFASFLLGNEGNAFFAFSGSRRDVATPALEVAAGLGAPIGGYRTVGGMYQRRFSGGIVLVDPTDETLTTDLGGNFRTADGRVVSSITLPPYTGMILPRA